MSGRDAYLDGLLEKSVPFGKKSRMRPLVFSFKPRSHA
jgi:hypothetical protein